MSHRRPKAININVADRWICGDHTDIEERIRRGILNETFPNKEDAWAWLKERGQSPVNAAVCAIAVQVYWEIDAIEQTSTTLNPSLINTVVKALDTQCDHIANTTVWAMRMAESCNNLNVENTTMYLEKRRMKEKHQEEIKDLEIIIKEQRKQLREARRKKK